MLCQYQETARKHAGCTITYSTLAVWILWLLDRSPASRHPSLTNPLLSQYNPEGAEEKNQSRRRLKLVLKTFKKLSSERVQQVPIYWRIIPFDTKNSFRVSAERVQSAPIYWRIIPFIKEAPTDQDCKWSPGK